MSIVARAKRREPVRIRSSERHVAQKKHLGRMRPNQPAFAAARHYGKTMPPREPTATKSRGRGGQLSEDEIVEAALRIIKRSGLAQLTMRRLADELGVTPMAAYHYVPSKEDLLQLVADSVLTRIRTPDADAPWDIQLRANAVLTFETLGAYPGLRAFVLDRPLSPATRRLMAKGVEMLRQAGFDQRDAVLAYETYHTYMFGLVGLEARFRPLRRRGATGERAIRADVSPRDFIDFGLDTLIAGLKAKLAATERSSRRKGE
jgi:TetR/AcrR family tetracycline transcriptional repressor